MEQLTKNLEAAIAAKGVSIKWIIEHTTLSERTVKRFFNGDAKNPSTNALSEIADVLDVTTDYLLKGTNAVLGTQDLATLQNEKDHLAGECAILQEQNDRLIAKVAELTDIVAELTATNGILKEQNWFLTSENNILKVKVDLKDEIIAVHNHYINKESQ